MIKLTRAATLWLLFGLLFTSGIGWAEEKPNGAMPVLRFTIGYPETDSRFQYVQSILRSALNDLGLDLELVASPVGREIFYALDNSADGISATIDKSVWVIDPQDLIQLPDPFVSVRNIVIARQGTVVPTTWQALNQSDLTMVSVRHHYSAKALLPDATMIQVETIDQAIEILASGRCDALVAFEAGYELSQHPLLTGDALQPAVELSARHLYTFVNSPWANYADRLNVNIQKYLKLTPWPGQEQLRARVTRLQNQ